MKKKQGSFKYSHLATSSDTYMYILAYLKKLVLRPKFINPVTYSFLRFSSLPMNHTKNLSNAEINSNWITTKTYRAYNSPGSLPVCMCVHDVHALRIRVFKCHRFGLVHLHEYGKTKKKTKTKNRWTIVINC